MTVSRDFQEIIEEYQRASARLRDYFHTKEKR